MPHSGVIPVRWVHGAGKGRYDTVVFHISGREIPVRNGDDRCHGGSSCFWRGRAHLMVLAPCAPSLRSRERFSGWSTEQTNNESTSAAHMPGATLSSVYGVGEESGQREVPIMNP